MRDDSLGLAGDGDVHDLVADIEHSFGIVLGDEFVRWTSVGEFETAVLERMPPSTVAGPSASLIAFHLLRRALADATASRPSPKTPLSEIRRHAPTRVLGMLERDLGLRLPPATIGPVGNVGMVLASLGFFNLFPIVWLTGVAWPSAALVICGAILRYVVDGGSYGGMTLGGLARHAAVRNYAVFAARGADRRPETIRRVLRCILARPAGLDPAAISPATAILADQPPGRLWRRSRSWWQRLRNL